MRKDEDDEYDLFSEFGVRQCVWLQENPGVELTSLSAPVNGVVTNNAAIDFAESTSEWGTMTHFVVYDALTGGNLLMYGELSASRRVEAATIMTIKLGSLNLSVVNPTA